MVILVSLYYVAVILVPIFIALHYTTNGGFHECVATLSKHGCDPNILDKSGLSALDIACERGHHLCIEPVI